MANTTGDAILNLVYDAIHKLLNVNISGITGSGIATETKQDDEIALLSTIAGDTTSIDGKITACNTGAVIVSSGAITETNSGTIKTNTDPLVTVGGGGYIRQDSTATICKESGGNLAAINANTATGTPQYGTDAAGADFYATVITTTAAKKHLYIVNAGTFPAIISLDSGVTDHLYIPGNSAATFDQITIGNSINIQAKNGTIGSNYTNLYLTTW
jgi:hypothetical protein